MTTPERPPAFACDYQRMWDLVRQQRAELLDSGLITALEYAQLCTEETRNTPGTGSPAPRRLESYDQVRAQLKTQRLEILVEVFQALTRCPIVRCEDDGKGDRLSMRRQDLSAALARLNDGVIPTPDLLEK
jgi:hypothetical protein